VNGPLEGFRVVEFGGYIAGPGVCAHLRAMGAEVIKIEPPTGDPARRMGAYGDAIWCSFNRGKRSVVLDLQDPGDRDAALQLLDTADVCVQNLRPGAVQRLGIDPETVTARNPGMVYLSVTGFSSTGPNAKRLGLDVAVQAESGMMSLTGEEGGNPLRVGYPIVDVASTHVGAETVLAALLGRTRTGRGRAIELSMFDVAVGLQCVPISTYLAVGREQGRRASGSPYNAPAAEVIDTRDGQLVLSAHVDQWRRLCAVIGRPDLTEDPRFATNDARVAHRAELVATLSDVLSDMDCESGAALLAENAIVVGVVRSYPQLLDSAEFRHGNYLVDASLPDGRVTSAVRPPVRLTGPAGSGATADDALPALGGSTQEVLAELRSRDGAGFAHVAAGPADSQAEEGRL
jgi:crotonobetainyl-CoA:carnitine CoA-transferase CaiB-like acyl-CoA transferase